MIIAVIVIFGGLIIFYTASISYVICKKLDEIHEEIKEYKELLK